MSNPKEGIFLKKNSKGYFITLKQNQHKLTMLGGYNTKANAWKGLRAVHALLTSSRDILTNAYKFTDLTVKPKKKVVLTTGLTYTAPSDRALKKLAKKSPPHIKVWLAAHKRPKKKVAKKKS